jgi:hypothetical protein
MDNKEEHLTSETYKEQIEVWYKTHNIIREKAELYYDFLFSLLDIVDETYLGSDVIKSDEDMINHFNWCFNKVISNFEQERIYFNNKDTHYDYLWVFFYKAYYTCPTENKMEILSEYFKVLFNFNRIKTPPELESFTDLYKIFDQNLKKIN